MSKLAGQTLVALSCLTILHAAFSTYEHLSTLKSLASHPSSLPISIVIEAIFALVLFLPGTAMMTGRLEDVTYRGEMAKRTIDDSDARMGFVRLSERGRALFGDELGDVAVEKR